MREVVAAPDGAAIQLPLFAADLKGQLRFLNDKAAHWWYDFPQDFPSSLIWDKLHEYHVSVGALVFDPFAGSGTTLVTAALLGLNGVGIEANPLLAFVSRAKTSWNITERQVAQVGEFLDAVLALPQELDYSDQDLHSIGMPQETLFRWLKPGVLADAVRIKRLLMSVKDEGVRNFIALAFSKSLYEASNVKFCPGITFLRNKKEQSLRAIVTTRLSKMVSDLKMLHSFAEKWGHGFGATKVVGGDARKSNELLEGDSVDFLITSPPYPGDVEYTRLFRLELYFLDFIKSMKDVQAIKRQMVRGTPKSIFKEDNNGRFVADIGLIREVSAQVAKRVEGKNWGWDYPRMVREYFGDMWVCLRAFHEILKPGAYALLIVGDQTVKGAMIPTGEILRQIGERLGYTEQRLELYRYRRSSTHSIPLAENIVILRK